MNNFSFGRDCPLLLHACLHHCSISFSFQLQAVFLKPLQLNQMVTWLLFTKMVAFVGRIKK